MKIKTIETIINNKWNNRFINIFGKIYRSLYIYESCGNKMI